jgi:hypothetical protein
MPKKETKKAESVSKLTLIEPENESIRPDSRMKFGMKLPETTVLGGENVSNSVSNFDEVDKEFGLTSKEIAFCQVYYNPGNDFGKHIEAYKEAFGISDDKIANVEGFKLLRKKNVKAFLKIILSIYRETALAKLIMQDGNGIAKLGGIKLSYEVDGDLKQSVEHIHTHTVKSLKKFSDEELDNYLELNKKLEGDKLIENG